MLICRNCEKYWKCGGDGNDGVCSMPNSFFPVKADQECVYLFTEKVTCKHCWHYANDTACMTCEADDDPCVAFDDVLENAFLNILFSWLKQGTYSREKNQKLCDSFEGTDEYKFVLDHASDIGLKIHDKGVSSDE